MRKLIIILTLSIVAILMVGCGTKDQASNTEALTKQSIQSTPSLPTATDTPNQTPSATAGGTTDTQKTQISTPAPNNSSGVVAKSNNAVSSQDKEDVLNQMDKELDSLFSDLGKLEDVQDSDLNLN
jgi:uncharacterized protein YcfL